MASRRPAPTADAATSDPDPAVSSSAAPDRYQEIEIQEDLCVRLVEKGFSRTPAFVLIGPSGTFKSSTANNLCGVENPGAKLRGRALQAKQREQIFKSTPFVDVSGKSCTDQCMEYRGMFFYVVDTPGFGDTKAELSYEKLQENDNITSLKIVEHLAGHDRGITAFVVFLPTPTLTRHDINTKHLFKRLLLGFDDPQTILEHMVIAHAFSEQSDVASKAHLAERTRAIVRVLLLELVRELRLDCYVPEDLPYACFSPFPDEGKEGECIKRTMHAFQTAAEMVEQNVMLRLSDPRNAKFTFKPRFPNGKCMHCSYDRRTANDGLSHVLVQDERKCHASVKHFETWQKRVGGITKLLVGLPLLGLPLLIPNRLWPFFDAEDFYCQQMRRELPVTRLLKGCPALFLSDSTRRSSNRSGELKCRHPSPRFAIPFLCLIPKI